MAPQPVLDRLAVLHSHCVTCAPAMVQAACLAALEWDPQEMVRAYELRRAYVCRRLGEMGLPCVRPAGAFYVFPSIASLSMSSEEFCLRLIQEAGVAAVPGTVFGKEGLCSDVLLLLHGNLAGGHGPAWRALSASHNL